MPKKKPAATPTFPARPYLTATDVETLGPSERIARGVVTERRDLAPSVARIMDAELDESARLRAIELFRDSLQSPGDPNRDPRAAIAAAAVELPTNP